MPHETKKDGQEGNNPLDANDLFKDLKEAAVFGLTTIALILFILGPLLFHRFCYGDTSESIAYEWESVAYRTFSVVALSMFVPCTAISYFIARRRVRKRELMEICRLLSLNYEYYMGIYGRETKQVHFFFAATFTFVVTLLGLTAVMLGAELNLNKGLNLLLRGSFGSQTNINSGGDARAHAQYQLGSLLFFGLAFLGAYLWGLQEIIRRYLTNDLSPGVYYTLGVRMIFAAILALLVYQIIGGNGSPSKAPEALEKFGGAISSLLAFLIGIFPQRVLQHFTDKISVFARPQDTEGIEVPLELIQGISVNDRMRLLDEGVDSCFDLAQADFIRLLFTTPFPAKQLIDWMLQAKLCVFFPDKLDDLRTKGVRTIDQLKLLDHDTKDTLTALTSETKLTHTTLERAKSELDGDMSVVQLVQFREYLGMTDLLMPPDALKSSTSS
ncbi:hypothetical protein [Pelagibius sp. Alg239-R121]|uniref:hypothetical protein n=1 Tax=Pelagibius sp. Alg239-R121 TaxID=2993448 RepID=UPI0024A62AD6|nr:hypothetical protein [Pelagibius sp. Alg239-R121]